MTMTTAKPVTHSTSNTDYDSDEDQQREPPKLKHYQIKAQKLLDDILKKRLELVRDPVHIWDNGLEINEGLVRLFKRSPPGIIFDHIVQTTNPICCCGWGGFIATARDACQKSMARQEVKDAAAKEKNKKEEERVVELTRIRGERWLRFIAREMQEMQCDRDRQTYESHLRCWQFARDWEQFRGLFNDIIYPLHGSK